MRSIFIVLDSLGIGGAPDADRYGDSGANTLGHIAAHAENGGADYTGLRQGPLDIPNLLALGLGKAMTEASGLRLASLRSDLPLRALYGSATEISLGKDTPSGHFEMTGVPIKTDRLMFPHQVPAIPGSITDHLIKVCGLPGILGNCHASGTEIIELLGGEHMTTGKPIFYTSDDSVMQIIAHEDTFGLKRLYELCEAARQMKALNKLGRVIARPFLGDGKDTPFRRTYNRRDFALACPQPNLLDHCIDAGISVSAIGKVGDIFAHRGISKTIRAGGNDDITDKLVSAIKDDSDNALIFANLVDFDSEYGHRRDVAGYAAALERFDLRLPEIISALRPGDLAVLTADHGNDPTFPGSGHTRERVPVIFFGPGIKAGKCGIRESLADMGQTMAQHLGLVPVQYGTAILAAPAASSLFEPRPSP
jgi:phosphopentomutase